MVKRWFMTTFAEQPSSDALPVDIDVLDVRMRRHLVIGDKGGAARRNSGCSKRTGASGDRTQRAGISNARPEHSDDLDCLVLQCSAAACGSPASAAKRRPLFLDNGSRD